MQRAMTDEETDAEQQDSGSTGDPELDRQVADLEQKGEKVQTGIEDTRGDWEGKKQDQSVPGAMDETEWADEDEADDAGAGDEEAGDEEGEHEEDEGE
jgi:hypothetical protein